MSEVNNRKNFLDYSGLEKYDKLIKSYIAKNNKSLASASDVSVLQVEVAALKEIEHDAYISADKDLEKSLKEYIDGEVEKKQDVISDLETIRDGAYKGATALQEIPSEFITENELADKKFATETQVEELIDSVVASDGDIDDIFTEI